jgi:hypothetical protein
MLPFLLVNKKWTVLIGRGNSLVLLRGIHCGRSPHDRLGTVGGHAQRAQASTVSWRINGGPMLLGDAECNRLGCSAMMTKVPFRLGSRDTSGAQRESPKVATAAVDDDKAVAEM